MLYENGYGVEKDYGKEKELYQKAAGKSNAVGMAYLGSMYEYGKGGLLNIAEAVSWYRQAKSKGNVFAAKALARLSRK